MTCFPFLGKVSQLELNIEYWYRHNNFGIVTTLVPGQVFAGPRQLLFLPVVLPGRYLSASLPLLAATSSFRGCTSSELAHFSVVLQGFFPSEPFGFFLVISAPSSSCTCE